MTILIYILFVFALGACIGSFLNVVVWRLPRGESLVTPPSHCPKCDRPLKWYDNLPVVGWLRLGGKCRFCKEPISARYPIVEAVTGGLFVLYFVTFFVLGKGPCVPALPGSPEDRRFILQGGLTVSNGWPIYALYMLLLSVLLAASLIDAEHFIIPIEMIWFVVAPIALAWHAIVDTPMTPGALNTSPAGAALAAGGGIGLLVSLALSHFGKIPISFADGGPLLEVEKAALDREAEEARREGRKLDYAAPPVEEYDKKRVRAEIRKEMVFLLPPMAFAAAFVFLALRGGPVARTWAGWISYDWVSGLSGSVLGMLVGGFVVWAVRILGTFFFGREAMGMGDVHLMAGVGAVVGGGAATVAFFLAPFFGIALAIYLLFTGKRRELPYGPYLSLATAFVMLFYCDIAAWMAPGLAGLRFVVGRMFGAGA